MGKYIRTLPSFEGGNWANFKVEVLEEFKDDDEEQKTYTVAYLRKYVQQIRKSKDADYIAMILDLAEKSRFLINARKLSEYRRVTLFLHAFSDGIGNKLCKRCNIDLDDPDTTDTVFPELKREALDLCVKEESQMQKLRKQIEFDFEDDEADVKQRKKEQERKKEPKKRAEERKDNVDDLAEMMKDLKIFQLEKQLAELAKASLQANQSQANQRQADQSQAGQRGQNPTALPYYPPNQYGNRQYPPNQRNMIRGCYYDGGAHSRETCEELQKALARGDVHKKGPVLFLGREDANSNIRVPIPTEDGSGKIMWQQEWVMNELMKKESQALGTANSVTLESGFSGVYRGVSCMSGASGEAYGGASCSGVSGGVSSGVSRGASSKGKGKANFHDDDDQDDFPVEFYNGHPVIRTTAQEKPISAAVDKMEAQIPQRILKRTQPPEDRMDIDDENRPSQQQKKHREPATARNANRDQETATKTKTVPFWEELRKEANITTINDKLMETVVPIKLKELLSISPDLISHWFGVKRVPPLQVKEKDLKEAFEVSAARWISKADERLYACATPRCKGSIEGSVEEALIDCGSELCLLSKSFFDTLEVPIDLEIDWVVGSANSTRSRVHGLCREVEVSVGGVKKVLPFFVMEHLAQDVILGRPWERMVRAKHDNRDDGSLFMTISDAEGNSATFCAVPADHECNRTVQAGKGRTWLWPPC